MSELSHTTIAYRASSRRHTVTVSDLNHQHIRVVFGVTTNLNPYWTRLFLSSEIDTAGLKRLACLAVQEDSAALIKLIPGQEYPGSRLSTVS